MSEAQKIQILETLAVLAVYVVVFFITKTIINNTLKKTQMNRARPGNSRWFIAAIVFTPGALPMISSTWRR